MRPPDWPSPSLRDVPAGPAQTVGKEPDRAAGAAADPGAEIGADLGAVSSADPGADSGAALTRLYRRWRAPLLRWLWGRGADRGEAEDLTQQVFTRLWASGQVPSDDRKAQAYLRQTARHLEIDRWRNGGERAMRQALSLDSGPDGGGSPLAAMAHERVDPLRLVEQRQQLGRLRDALAELPPRQGEALTLYLSQGLTHEQIAERMAISARMVSRHISRGLAYCTLRLEYGSVEQMQRLRMTSPGNDVGQGAAPGGEGRHGHHD